MTFGAGDLHENCLKTLISVDVYPIQSLVYMKFKCNFTQLLKNGPPYNKIIRHGVGSTALKITNHVVLRRNAMQTRR